MNTSLKLFFISCLISSFLSALSGFFIYQKGRYKNAPRIWFLHTLTVAWWSFFLGIEVIQTNQEYALFWSRIMHYGVCFLPAFFTHYVYELLEMRQARTKVIVASYFGAFLLSVLNVMGFLVPTVSQKLFFRFYTDPSIAYFFLMLYFFIFISLTHFEMFQVFISTRSKSLSLQIKYMFLASFIGYSAGSWTYGPVFNFWMPPIIMYFMVLYVFIMGYAIIIHRLFDIEVIIRRTLVFAGLFSFAFAVFAFSTFLTQELMSAYVSGKSGRVLSLVISVFLIVLVYEPLRRFLINLTDKFLFQKKYDYRKLLRDASAGISQIKSLHQLLSLVTHFVTMRIRVRNAAILIHDQKNDYFKLAYMRGYASDSWLKADHIFNEKDPLLDYLAIERVPLDIERVKEFAETGGPKPKKGISQTKYDYKAIRQRMEELHAACCVPSFLGNNLRNILILGEKKSGDFFTDEDLHVLYTLAQESAIAIENARLYDQAIEKARELEGINEQLNTAQTNLLRALNETEIANKKLRDTHAQLIHEQKMATLGRLASSVGHEVNNPLTILSMNVSRAILKYRQNPDLKVTEILDIFSKMEQNISRIKAVVNTLTGLLKKSEHGKFEALSLKLVLEETLPLVQFQTYLENLSGTEVNFEIPGAIPLIKGDLERLQEVFLNLFINAYHAMASKRDRKITVTAHEDPAHPAMVVVEFSDNGHGMSDEVMKKIFSYGFTTKPAGKGSGMGLYMCRYILELHGGDIKVRSKPGEGTTFVITLPIAHVQSTLGESSAGPSAEQK